ncbi:hypothetical protein DL767_008150 [Monosporascus sp. MG133]|nr:hypothetical protein DL767_008150 [Monosporascus sp. MG133]
MASNNESQRQSRWVELFDPENYYPVLEVLSSYLTIADFLVLCQVCKGLDGLKNCMLRKISNINVRLRDFVDDAVMFRSQLGNYGALISGLFALNIFELGHRKVLYLDVFIEDGANADQFTKYIREIEKYQNDNPEVETTLINHQFYPLGSLDNDFGSNLKELANQGWTTRDIIWPDFASGKARKFAGLRRVGGSSTLVIPLDIGSIQAPSTPDFSIEYAQFEVSWNERQLSGHQNIFRQNQFHQGPLQNRYSRNLFLTIRSEEMVSPAVRHGYTTASTGWHSYVTDRLRRWAWLELYKLGSENPLLQVTDPLSSDVSIPEDFELPQSWDYADDQIPGWYREWEQAPVENGVP